MKTKRIVLHVDTRVIRSLQQFLDLKTHMGARKRVDDEFIYRIIYALNRGEGEITLRFPLRPTEVQEEENPSTDEGRIVK